MVLIGSENKKIEWRTLPRLEIQRYVTNGAYLFQLVGQGLDLFLERLLTLRRLRHTQSVSTQ